MSNQIACPNCNHEIAVNEVMQSQLSEEIRSELQAEFQVKQAEVVAAKKQLAQQEALLADQKRKLVSQVAAGIESERTKIMAEAKKGSPSLVDA